MRNVFDQLFDIYSLRATNRYGLSEVNQLEHALQSAALAEREGEIPAMIVAALLHDVGHMLHELGEHSAEEGIDDEHERRGADWLSPHFSCDVTEPIRLHVPAKRYLCAVDSEYFAKLSVDSVRSLALQGGPMSADEAANFEKNRYAQAAVRLRRIDEAAKAPNTLTPSLNYFMRFVKSVLTDVSIS